MRLDTMKEQEIKTRCETALEKLKALQPQLNAIVTFVDIDEQLEGLKDISADAPLYGMPVVLKDNISTCGIRTTASSRILDNYVPVYDAAIVEKLKAAGAVIIAKASMDELGMGGTNKALAPSCKGAKLLEGKVFKLSASADALRTWAESCK